MFFFSLILTTSTIKHPDRLRVMIPLSTCWHVLGVQAANTPVLLPEPWEWRLSLYISKDDGFLFQCLVCSSCISLRFSLLYVFVRRRYSGVLSAYGLALADVVEEVQEPCSLQYEQHYFPEIDQRVEQLSKRCRDTLCARGFSRSAKNTSCICVSLQSSRDMFFHS